MKIYLHTKGVLPAGEAGQGKSGTPLRYSKWIGNLLNIKNTILFLFIVLICFLLPNKVSAIVDCPLKTNPPSPITVPNPNVLNGFAHLNEIELLFNIEKLRTEILNYTFGGNLYVYFENRACGHVDTGITINSESDIPSGFTKLFTKKYTGWTWDLCDKPLQSSSVPHIVKVVYGFPNGQYFENICSSQSYSIQTEGEKPSKCKVSVNLQEGIGDVYSKFKITISDISFSSDYDMVKAVIDNEIEYLSHVNKDQTSVTIEIKDKLQAKTYEVVVYPFASYQHHGTAVGVNGSMCDYTTFEVMPQNTPIPTIPKDCFEQQCDPKIHSNVDVCQLDYCKNCPICKRGSLPIPALKSICEQIGQGDQGTDCMNCVNIDHGIWTAIGCLPTDFSALLKDYVFTYGIGIAGGIAFLYFLYGVFLILTSAGNAEQIEKAKQIIVSSLSGLLLIIFSVFLLKVIGVDILKLPDFGPTPSPTPTPS